MLFSNIEIPDGTECVVVGIRHSDAVAASDVLKDRDRYLSPKGVEMCRDARPYYLKLVEHLVKQVGTLAVHATSEYVRTHQTEELLFDIQDDSYSQIALLNWRTGLEPSAKEKEWFTLWKEKCELTDKPLEEVLRRLAPFVINDGKSPSRYVAYQRYVDFITWYATVPLTVFVGHEPTLTLASYLHLPERDLGFKELEGAVFFVRDHKIISATKVNPF